MGPSGSCIRGAALACLGLELDGPSRSAILSRYFCKSCRQHGASCYRVPSVGFAGMAPSCATMSKTPVLGHGVVQALHVGAAAEMTFWRGLALLAMNSYQHCFWHPEFPLICSGKKGDLFLGVPCIGRPPVACTFWPCQVRTCPLELLQMLCTRTLQLIGTTLTLHSWTICSYVWQNAAL